MFADSLCDSAWANSSHRGWTALASFSLQMLAVGGLLALPLLYNQTLPQLRLTGADLIAPRPPAPLPNRAVSTNSAVRGMASQAAALVAPSSVPLEIARGDEARVPPQVDASDLGVRRGSGDPGGGVLNSIGTGISIVAAPPPTAIVRKPPVSHMMEGNLIVRVQPDYPTIARLAGIQGPVLLRAIINREGSIENLQVVSGPATLVQAALTAVRQWKYRPYALNGEPVEVETQITVNFILNR